jgi:hypothetical protein
MSLKILFVALIFSIHFNCRPQKEKGDCLGTWTVVSGKHVISDRLSIPTIGILRNYEVFHRYEFAFFRTGLTYQISPKFSGTLGYAYLDSKLFIDSPEALGAQQQWLYEELSHKMTLGKLGIFNRVRVESRWKLNPMWTDISHRTRYKFLLTRPIWDNFYLKFYNELFINLQESLFNQNRLHLGIGYKFTTNFKIEMGYLKNHFLSINYDRLRLGIIFNTDLRGKSTSK